MLGTRIQVVSLIVFLFAFVALGTEAGLSARQGNTATEP